MKSKPVGAIFLAIEIMAFSATNVVIKVAANGMSVHAIVCFRFAFAALLLTSLCIFMRRSFPTTLAVIARGLLNWNHIKRAVVICAATTLWAYALIMLPLATATCLYFTKAIFIGVFSRLILGEPASWRQWVSIVLGIIGVVVATQPSVAAISIAGCLVALTSAAAAGLGAVQTKAISRHVGALEMSTIFAILMTLLSAPAALADWNTMSISSLSLMILAAALLVASLVSTVFAFRVVPLPTIAVVDFARFALSIPAGVLFFGDAVSISMVFGGCIIIAAIGLLFAHPNNQRQQRPGSLGLVD